MKGRDDETNVVVAGFGGAGVVTALKDRENGTEVVALDRLTGGGPTAISGDIVSAGDGTPIQAEAGVEDSVQTAVEYP